jgi:2-succinyl-5-enolpyruvyl-6-hydroxy-3-cyclohexene-1-carboxylate synthase
VVLLDPDGAWLDPDALATDVLQSDTALTLAQLATQLQPSDGARAWQQSWAAADRLAGDAIEQRLETLPLFEAHAVRALARTLRGPATVVLGSSMAIRDADWFWPRGAAHTFIANRGVSGIDGFTSTVLGAALANDVGPTVALCGDLTFYHDMNGLLAARAYAIPVTFVVLNNAGGGIFSFLRESAYEDVFEDVFTTPSGLDLERVAALYDCEYRSAVSIAELEQAVRSGVRRTLIVDVRFTRDDSVSGHRALWAAASSATPGARPIAPGT